MFDPVESVPEILNSSPAATLIATPKVKPVSTAADRNWEIQPIFSTAITTNNRPAVSTTAAATATASGDPAVASDTTAAPSTGAVEELGPWVT